MNNPFKKGEWVKTPQGVTGFVVVEGVTFTYIHVPGKHEVYNYSLGTVKVPTASLKSCEEISEEARKAFIDWALDRRYFDLLEG